MAAYGALTRPATSYLPPTAWPHPRDPNAAVTLFHVDASTVDAGRHPGLFDHLHVVFADEVDNGLTYPQEDMRDPDAFKAYFFAADVIVAIDGGGSTFEALTESEPGAKEVEVDLEIVRAGRPWDACLVGFYYVKPNYPGRSSHGIVRFAHGGGTTFVCALHHARPSPEPTTLGAEVICNAGFVVPPAHRNGGFGRLLARSFLHYGPRLGYQASVFNLVYVNNVASVRLWEKLGFVKAGRIPKAGRLKRTDGGEEYVDAWVIYKSFDEGGR